MASSQHRERIDRASDGMGCDSFGKHRGVKSLGAPGLWTGGNRVSGRCRRVDTRAGRLTRYSGREMPSFFIFQWKVERFIPRRLQPRWGPPRTQLASRTARRMCSLSASLRSRLAASPHLLRYVALQVYGSQLRSQSCAHVEDRALVHHGCTVTRFDDFTAGSPREINKFCSALISTGLIK